jgi:hypothetical protein
MSTKGDIAKSAPTPEEAPLQNSVGALEFCVLPLQPLELSGLLGAHSGPRTTVDFMLANPLPHGLGTTGCSHLGGGVRAEQSQDGDQDDESRHDRQHSVEGQRGGQVGQTVLAELLAGPLEHREQ